MVVGRLGDFQKCQTGSSSIMRDSVRQVGPASKISLYARKTTSRATRGAQMLSAVPHAMLGPQITLQNVYRLYRVLTLSSLSFLAWHSQKRVEIPSVIDRKCRQYSCVDLTHTAAGLMHHLISLILHLHHLTSATNTVYMQTAGLATVSSLPHANCWVGHILVDHLL